MYHADGNIANTFRFVFHPLIGVRNGNRLFDGAFGKVLQVYFDFELFQAFFGCRIGYVFLLIGLDHEYIVDVVIGQLGIGTGGDYPGQYHRNNQNNEEDGKGGREVKLFFNL